MDDGNGLDLTGLNPVALPARKIDRACEACIYSAREKPDLVCRYNPPQVTFLAVPQMTVVQTPQGPRQQQAMAVTPFAAFPIVRSDQWCAKFEQK